MLLYLKQSHCVVDLVRGAANNECDRDCYQHLDDLHLDALVVEIFLIRSLRGSTLDV